MEGGPDANSALARGPDFLCIGAQKAGTQWLYDQLALHPQVWMPPIKEIHFFDGRIQAEKIRRTLDRAENRREAINKRRVSQFKPPFDERDIGFLRHAVTYDPETSDIEWYAKLFAEKGDQISGDITPRYALLPRRTIKKIYKRFPDLKIIYLVRDPIERAWSAMSMYWRRHHGQDDSRMADSPEIREYAMAPNFIHQSEVTNVIKVWRDVFPAERFHVALFDDIKARPDEVVDAILDYLGVKREPQGMAPANFNRKQGKRSVGLPDDVRALLVTALGDEICSAAKLLGGAAASWPARYGLD